MPNEPADQDSSEKLLSKLTVKKLKALAKKHKVDVSKCRKKAEYIETLLTGDDIEEIIRDGEFFEREAKDLEALKTEISETGEDIEEVVEEVEELPELDDEKADTLVSQRINMDIGFEDVEDISDQIRMRFEEKNYIDALGNSLSARELLEFKKLELERYIWAYSISAAQRIIGDCGKAGAKVDKAVRLLLSAKDSYRNDDIIDNRDLIDDLQKTSKKLLRDEVKKAKKHLLAKEERINEAKNLGVDVRESEELLKTAMEVLERNDHLQSTKYANEAAEKAAASIEKRMDEIRGAIPITQQIIDEAKQLGSDVEEAEKLLKQAEAALEKDDYMLTSELTKRAETVTIETQSAQTQKAMDLRQRLVGNISQSINQIEPMVMEAEKYGLDVREPREMLQRAKLALESQDYANGTLYVKSAEEGIGRFASEIEMYRTGSAIPKPTRGICSKCKNQNLKFFDNGWGKCFDCGHIFKWMTEKPPEKEEKKGLFGRFKKK